MSEIFSSPIRVMMINANPRTMSLVQPVVALFHTKLKEHGIDMKFFDTTFYDLSEDYVDSNQYKEGILGVKQVKNKTQKSMQERSTALFKDFRNSIIEYQPHVLLASAMESTMQLTRHMLGSVRNLGIPHVLGGVFATFVPELSISYEEIDVICVGEAENIIVPLVQQLAAGKKVSNLPGIWEKNQDGTIDRAAIAPPVNISNNPRFDASIFDETRFYRPMAGQMYRMFPVESHRGCTLKCTFCNSPIQNSLYKEETGAKFFRKKSIKRVMEDVRYFVEEMKAEYLFFWADNFLTYSNKEIDAFCKGYAEYRIPFYAQSYPTSLNEYKISKLAEVGLDRLGMGVEHGNEKFRKQVVNRTYTNQKAIEQVGFLRKYNIQYSCNNIVGFPMETPELHMDTVRLNRALSPHTAGCSIFTPFHGTPLRELCLKLGYLENPDIIAPTNNEQSILNMPQFTKDQIYGKARTFGLYLKFPENRWKDIEKAEKITQEGNQIWLELKEEYHEKYDREDS